MDIRYNASQSQWGKLPRRGLQQWIIFGIGCVGGVVEVADQPWWSSHCFIFCGREENTKEVKEYYNICIIPKHKNCVLITSWPSTSLSNLQTPNPIFFVWNFRNVFMDINPTMFPNFRVIRGLSSFYFSPILHNPQLGLSSPMTCDRWQADIRVNMHATWLGTRLSYDNRQVRDLKTTVRQLLKWNTVMFFPFSTH